MSRMGQYYFPGSNSGDAKRFQTHGFTIAFFIYPEVLFMFLVIGIILFLAWIGGFVVFHVTSFFIHILLILAIIAIVFHFLRGSRTA